jgi:hypothetical protein
MMAEEPDNITLRQLRRMDEKLDRLADTMSDMAVDIRSMKTHMAGFMQNEVVHDTAIASIRDRLSRVERRLDLTEGETK